MRVHPRARRSGEGRSQSKSGGGGRTRPASTFTENEEGTSARFHSKKKRAARVGFWDKWPSRSSRRLSTNQSVGNLSEIEAIQSREHCVFPESSSATARSSGLISAHASPSTQLKHRKDGLPLRHQRPRRAARRRAHQQAVRTRFRRETPRKFFPMRHDAMPTPAHRREPRLRRRAVGAGTRPTRGEDAADARPKRARRVSASRFARSGARPRPPNRRPIARVFTSRDATDAQFSSEADRRGRVAPERSSSDR